MKFKTGDRVKTKVWEKGSNKPEYKEGTIVDIDKRTRSYEVRFEDIIMWVHEASLEAVEYKPEDDRLDQARELARRRLKEMEEEDEEQEAKELALELTKAWAGTQEQPVDMEDIIATYFYTIKRLKEEHEK